MRYSTIIGIFCIALTIPVAQAQLFVDSEIRQTVNKNSRHLNDVTNAVRDLNSRLETLTEQNNQLRKQITKLSQQKQQLQQQLREFTGILEEIQHVQQENNNVYVERLKPLIKKTAELNSAITLLAKRVGFLEESTPLPPEGQLYADAFTLLQAQEYDGAIKGFSNLLHSYPDGQFSTNAQYWISKAHLSQERYQDAKNSAETLVEQYPGNDKEPDTLLIIAKASFGLQETERAKKILEKLVELYPTSLAADEARQLLLTE